MYKRRDWLHLHGADGASDSSDDNSSSDESKSSSEKDGSGSGGSALSDGGSESSDEGVRLGQRLEDLSEDDMDDNDWEAAGNQQELEDQLERWVTATDVKSEKGRPLKCRLCAGALILNAKALRQHLDSKKHEKKVDAAEAQGLDAGFDFCFAEDFEPDDGETHQERMVRIIREVEAAKQQQAQQQQDQVEGKRRKKKLNKGKAAKQLGREQEPGKHQQLETGRKKPGKQQQQQDQEQGKSQPQEKQKAGKDTQPGASFAVTSAVRKNSKGVPGQERQKQERKRPGKRQREQLKQSGQLPQKMNSEAKRRERRKQRQRQQQPEQQA